jgi:hypothetical protein
MEAAGLLFQDRVRERDLDNFLIEELAASIPFRTWFIAQLEGFVPPAEAEVRLQKSPPRLLDARQTDVRIGWFSGDDLKACVLIESKVTADFELGQAEAYRAEVQACRSELGPAAAYGVLVAPSARMSALAHDGAFDTTIPIEDLVTALSSRLPEEGIDLELRARLMVRIDLLETLLGKRSGTGWEARTVRVKRNFAISYAELARELVPSLNVRPSSDGPKSLTRFFDGLEVARTFPSSVGLKHEFGGTSATKYVNLQFSGMADRLAAVQASGLVSPPAYAAAPGKSLFVRVDTPGIDPEAPFDEQRERLSEGLRAIGRLATWFRTNQEQLGSVLAAAPISHATTTLPSVGTPKQFDAAMRALYQASVIAGYTPHELLRMIETQTGLGAARALLAKPNVSIGFTNLWELGRPELTVEALVLEQRWRDLFTPHEQEIAGRRLVGWRR